MTEKTKSANNNKKGWTEPQSETSERSRSDDSEHDTQNLKDSLAKAETRTANILRVAVLLVLTLTAGIVSAGVYIYTHNQELDKFHTRFRNDAYQVMESFHELVEQNIGTSAWMSTTITSYALANNLTFPFVSLPHFELRASHLRVLSGSRVLHYAPIVTDEQREEWEAYAMENRFHINASYDRDVYFRNKQDSEMGLSNSNSDGPRRAARRELQGNNTWGVTQGAAPTGNLTTLGDGTGYHPKIWRPFDEPPGSGPYIPSWHRSPVNPGRQEWLNMNWAKSKALPSDIIQKITTEEKAFLTDSRIPVPRAAVALEENLKLSQYREHYEEFFDTLNAFLVYPVFDSFGEDKQAAGVLLTSIYWNLLFTDLLPSGSQGIICVVDNPDQTFTYRINGNTSEFVGMGDHHDHQYDDLEISVDINEYLSRRERPENRAYLTVPLSSENKHRMRIYPSEATEEQFVTRNPMMYTWVVISAFGFTSILFLLFSYVVEKRQYIMMEKVVENARRAAIAERELNEFLAHEVRNPLSAAMSACSFVSTAVNEPNPMADEESKKYVRQDIEVVSSSLHFINDFLRSMLDIHQDRHIKVKMAPTDLLKDVLDPVSNILYKRMANFDVIVDCPENLMVLTDAIRLKQVVLNLVRNSSKFVERGFLRMRACIVNQQVQIRIEDSGPGIPPEKRDFLFDRYQQSLDILSQGTGVGLSLSKKLMETMNGELWLDDTYNSGVEGCPGACFVADLRAVPLDIESALPMDEKELCGGANTTCKKMLDDGIDKPENDEARQPSSAPSVSTDIRMESSQPEQPEPVLPRDLAVLFVDDDAVLRKLFVRAVKRVEPSWKIQEASNGETALRLCQDEAFDVIFLDQYMASVDKQLLGTETAQIMRARGIKSKICGLSANDLQDLFISSGADDFLMKPLPCKVPDLKEVLFQILSPEEQA